MIADAVLMRQSRSHRRAKEVRAAFEAAGIPLKWGYSYKDGWYWYVPPEGVPLARQYELTIARVRR